ncbi:amidase, partial [Lecanoromycetidae sp. Uapishka_2]
MTGKAWQEIAKEAQDYRDASISRVKPAIPDVPKDLPLDRSGIPKYLLGTEEVVITETSPEGLVALLAVGKLTSTAVTTAFLRRAGLAQALTNCITELLPERAIHRAKYLDDYFTKHTKPIGPLHGLPISVKEHIGMKGLGHNAGFISWWDHKAADDAHVLKILWNAGCVFYARTTQPQTLMHLETSSNLYGITTNPFNAELTSGGSSGGEGALLGMRGSCLGLGTDIGGSIRSPAANCGLYGLRPSSYRIPVEGWAATMAGEEQVVPVLGPLSTSLEGVKMFMKTVIVAKPWLTEPSLIPIPWRDQESHVFSVSGMEKLKVGVLWHDKVVRPHPPVLRALQEVVDKLKCVDDIEVVDWKPYKHELGWEIISSLYFGDGAQQEIDEINASGEPWRPLSKFIIKENPNVKKLSVEEIWSWTVQREAYRSAYAQNWNDTATRTGDAGEPEGMVDVILCPVGPGAALPLNCTRYWGYTAQWNILDYPALVFPVTKVDMEVDKVDEGYEPMNEKDEYNHQLWQSGPEKYKGAPVSLQLVGRRYEDEKVVEALELIKESIGLPFAQFV